jgi:LmbE family N-acetylglucosaminyl deacetylase
MSQTFQRIGALVAYGDVKISAHGYDESAADGILVREILASVEPAVVVTAYRPDPAQSHPRHRVRSLSRQFVVGAAPELSSKVLLER